jgi:hypothetical protein
MSERKPEIDDDWTEDQWEGSVCAVCGKNEVRNGKYVSGHDQKCKWHEGSKLVSEEYPSLDLNVFRNQQVDYPPLDL